METGTWKKCSTSLSIKEMQIKTTMSHYFILARMTFITETTNKCLWGCGETGTLVQCWRKYKLVATTTDNLSVKFPHKIKKLTYHRIQQFHFWRIYLKKTERLIQKDKCIPMFTAAIFKSQDTETTYLSMDEWIKNDETHTHTQKKWDILLSHKKKNETMPFATIWMDLQGMLSEVSKKKKKKKKDKYYMISLTCEIFKNHKLELIDTENTMVVARGEGQISERGKR